MIRVKPIEYRLHEACRSSVDATAASPPIRRTNS